MKFRNNQIIANFASFYLIDWFSPCILERGKCRKRCLLAGRLPLDPKLCKVRSAWNYTYVIEVIGQMLSFYKKYSRTAFDIALMIVTVYLFMLLFSYLYRIATPIFLAFVIFAAIEPLAKFLHRKGLKKSLATAVSMMVFVTVILVVLIGAGIIFTTQILNIAEKIPHYKDILLREITRNVDFWTIKFEALPSGVTEKLEEYSSNIAGYVSSAASWLLTRLAGWLTSVSSFVVNFIVGIILAYFLSVEIELWKRLAGEKTPGTFKKAFFFLKENVLLGIVAYIKAQLKLVSITFVLVFVGLLVLGVKNTFSISLLSAVFDVLPLLGISTVFIPWIAYLFIVGETALAISLSVLLAVIIIVRQIMEPKITGESLGVSAFTVLSFMIVSLSIFGVAGLILSPILIILIRALYKQGYLKRWIHLPEEEFEHTYID